MLNRLQEEIAAKSALSDAQYGFRKCINKPDSIKKVLEKARKNPIKTHKITDVLIALDVKNAFTQKN